MCCSPASRCFCSIGNGARSRSRCGPSAIPPVRSLMQGICWAGWAVVLLEHLPHQSFRAVRPAPGLCPLARSDPAAAGVQDAVPLQAGSPSHLPWLPDGLLGDAIDDGRAPALCGGHHGLHPHRYLSRGTRPHSAIRRSIPALPRAGLDAHSPAPVGLRRTRAPQAKWRGSSGAGSFQNSQVTSETPEWRARRQNGWRPASRCWKPLRRCCARTATRNSPRAMWLPPPAYP